MKRSLIIVALLAMIVLGVGYFDFGRASRAEPKPTAALDFVERVLGAEGEAKLPLVVALHGLGDTPESFVSLYEELGITARVIAPRAPDPYAVGTSWFPIDDPKRAPQVLLARAKLLDELLRKLPKTRPTRGLPIVTGFSQGGMLSFALAAYHAEHIASALPIAGMLPDVLPRYRKAPAGFRVLALHGTADARIPFAGAERTVSRLREVGTRVSLEPFEGVGHTISPAMRDRYAALLRAELKRSSP